MSAHDDAIELVLPARTELAATLRVVAASLGADVGLTVDEIDDLRLALNEVFTSAADETGADQRVSITFVVGDDRLDVAMHRVDGGEISLDDLASTILRSVVELTDSDGPQITFRKRATEAAR